MVTTFRFARVRNHRREMGPRFSEGARLLWQAAVFRDRLTMRQIRDRLGGTSDVPRWLYGDRVPVLRALMRIHKLWKIPVTAWAEPPKKPFVPPALREEYARDATGTEG